MDVRRAIREDLPHVATLFEQAALPPLPPGLPLQNCLVALEGGRVVGAIAMDVRGLRGLLCGVVVEPDHRRQGLGESLLDSLLARANELSLRDLYVLPGDEEAFFTKHGFVPVAREDVASEIRAMRIVRDAEPEAPAMRFPLATRFV